MLWLQLLPAFLLWLTYIYVRRGWMAETRNRFPRIPRQIRIFAMLAAVLGSLGLMVFAAFALEAIGWVRRDGISLPGHIAVATVGLVFVHLQMLATALTLSLALDNVATPRARTSNQETHRGEQ